MNKHPQIVRQHLLAATLDETPAIESVQAARITLEPRQPIGRHHHLCPVVGYGAAGTIRFQIEGQPVVALTLAFTARASVSDRTAHEA